MGEIEHVKGDRSPLVPAATELVAATYPGHPGEPLAYEAATYDIDASWRLLPKSMQNWAEERAGPPIRDPHTRQSTIYWYCRVAPKLSAGPAGAARPAVYDLVMFGKHGLVAATGTTDHVETQGGPRWVHRRFGVEIDPSGLRHDHHREAPANLMPSGSAAPDSQDPGGMDPVAPAATALLPAHIVGAFGNLPLVTQQFLMEAFVRQGRRPVEGNVYATTRIFGADYRESLWTYLFDARRMAFAHAHRSVPWRSGRTGPALWTGSPEAEALRVAPWMVVAWTAPCARRDGPGESGAGDLRSGGGQSAGAIREKDPDP